MRGVSDSTRIPFDAIRVPQAVCSPPGTVTGHETFDPGYPKGLVGCQRPSATRRRSRPIQGPATEPFESYRLCISWSRYEVALLRGGLTKMGVRSSITVWIRPVERCRIWSWSAVSCYLCSCADEPKPQEPVQPNDNDHPLGKEIIAGLSVLVEIFVVSDCDETCRLGRFRISSRRGGSWPRGTTTDDTRGRDGSRSDPT